MKTFFLFRAYNHDKRFPCITDGQCMFPPSSSLYLLRLPNVISLFLFPHCHSFLHLMSISLPRMCLSYHHSGFFCTLTPPLDIHSMPLLCSLLHLIRALMPITVTRLHATHLLDCRPPVCMWLWTVCHQPALLPPATMLRTLSLSLRLGPAPEPPPPDQPPCPPLSAAPLRVGVCGSQTERHRWTERERQRDRETDSGKDRRTEKSWRAKVLSVGLVNPISEPLSRNESEGVSGTQQQHQPVGL